MNDFLAQLYGTAENIGAAPEADDQTKLAQAQVLDEMFAAEGIDIDAIDPDAVVKVASTMFGDDNQITPEDVQTAQAGEPADDAQEKLAEADFLGRVMAHAFVDEQTSIGKEASAGSKVWEALKGAATGKNIKGGLSKLRESKKLQAAGEAAKGMGARSSKRSKQYGEIAGKRLSQAGAAKGEGRKTLAKGIAGTGALYGGGAAALGGAGYAAGRAGKKKESAIEALGEQRLSEILEANGLEYTGAPEPSGEEKLASAVDAQALELAQELGIYDELVERGIIE